MSAIQPPRVTSPRDSLKTARASARLASRQTPWLLRAKLGVYLLAIDCMAFITAAVIARSVDLWQLLVLAEICALIGGYGKLYRSRLTLAVLDDLPYLVGTSFVALLTELSLKGLAANSTPPTRLAIQMSVLLVLLVVLRTVAYQAVRYARAHNLVRHRVLVLGAGRVGTQLVRTLKAHPEFGLDTVGFWDPEPRTNSRAELGTDVFGSDDSLTDVILDHGVQLVVIAFSRIPESELVSVLRTCDRLHCEIYVVPRLFELHAITRDMDSIWGVPLEHIRRTPFRTFTWRFKRLMDVVISAIGLMLLSPVLAACATAVRLEGGPGVIFRQVRVGLDGRRLTVLKFRSMRPINEHESATNWNIADDDRIGPVGHFLRKTSLDELPQLWNVLTGDMSLVGPRPERPHFADEFAKTIPRYAARHRVPAGVTGWAQIHGLRGDTSIEDRAIFDNTYVENWSLWGDIKIMLRTVEQVMGRKGN